LKKREFCKEKNVYFFSLMAVMARISGRQNLVRFDHPPEAEKNGMMEY
jgi:hypothetical protein